MISQTNTYLFFDGDCAEAIEFYEKVLGAKVDRKATYGEAPAAAHVPAAMRDRIMHISFRVGDTVMMASDNMSEELEGEAHRFGVTLQTTKHADAERVFRDLSEGGEVTMPMDKTFFAERYGHVTDKFGIPWMVICEKES